MKKIFSISLVLMVFLAACAPSQGNVIIPNTGGDSSGSSSDSGQVSNPPVLVATDTVEIPVSAAITVTSKENANCRSGPGTVYDILAVFMSGETASVLGKNTNDGLWYKIQLADGTICFVGDSVVTLTGDAGSLAVVTAPPTPTAKPKPSWAGSWNSSVYLPGWGTTVSLSFTASLNGSGQVIFHVTFPCCGTYYATGTPSADGTYMEGFMQKSGGGDKVRFRFWFVESNPDQFQGQFYYDSAPANNGDWCGSRNGASLPNPCRR